MEATVEYDKIVINLKMSALDARWLRDVVQNPLHGETTDTEEEVNHNARAKIWNALNSDKIISAIGE